MKLTILSVWGERAILGSIKFQTWNLNRLTHMYTIRCMWQGISLKSERNNPWFKPWLCSHCIRSMFSVLGIYNFARLVNVTCNLSLARDIFGFTQIILWVWGLRTKTYLQKSLKNKVFYLEHHLVNRSI